MIPVISEVLVGVVAKTVLEHLAKQGVELALPDNQIRSWLGRDRIQLAMQLSLTRALGSFAQQHPDWAASLFDQAFLAGPAAPLLAQCLTPAGAPDPTELAALWAAQFGSAASALERRATEAVEAARDFLHLFEAELRKRDEFRPIYDSRALDAIDQNAAETAETLRGLRADLERALEDANQKYQVSLDRAMGTLVGDNGQQINVFNLYRQATRTLADRIRTQEFETLIRERTTGFVGRDFIFRAIDDWLVNPDFQSGYIVVRGEPGIGKTALLGELVKRRGYVHHFNVGSQNIRSVRDFLSNTCAQLIVRYDLDHADVPQEATLDSGFLSRLLAEAADKMPGTPVVVVVDALDEAEDTGLALEANRLFLPPTLPPRVYFIVSTREKEEYRLVVDDREDIYLDDSSPENQEDIRRYIRNFVAEHHMAMSARLAEWTIDEDAFESTLTERSQGNFMYLVYVLKDILLGKLNANNIDTMSNLPRGLKEYYRRHWRTLQVQDGQLFDREYKPVILILAAAREPVTRLQVAEWTHLGSFEIQRVLASWREFLNEDAYDGVPRYRIYHASFQDFLREDVGLKEQHSIIAQTALSKIPGFLGSGTG